MNENATAVEKIRKEDKPDRPTFVESMPSIIKGATTPTDLSKVKAFKHVRCYDMYFMNEVPVDPSPAIVKVMSIDFANDFDALREYAVRTHYARNYSGDFAEELASTSAYICDSPSHFFFGDLIVNNAGEVFQVVRGD